MESSRSRLDSAAVHALSNHLAVILGFIELMLSESGPDDPRQADLLEMRNAAAAMASILGRPFGDGGSVGAE